MNLIAGCLMSDAEAHSQLEKLDALILQTHQGDPLPVDRVIAACDALSDQINETDHLGLLVNLGMPVEKARRELALVKEMMRRAWLEQRLQTEFGPSFHDPRSFISRGQDRPVRQAWKPLGTLLHIAAGNVDALPVFSVIEGLLTGNINILKLPGTDAGLSTAILGQLMGIEPAIIPYVFVFDTPSTDLEAMEKMAACADAVVVWGGDAAVSAVRQMARPDTRIIEWGHKISFAYVSAGEPVSGEAVAGEAIPDAELEGIAYNICDTEQLLCSACQGIYLDTDRFDVVVQFAQRFLEILNAVAARMPARPDPYLAAQKTLELYTEDLESLKTQKRVFRAEHASVTAYADPALHPSYMFRNPWVKPLPQKDLLAELLKYKNHLQTAALVCGPEQKPALEALFEKTGVVRLTSGARMSAVYCGQPHDGEFALRRYMKIMSCEY
jgi:hypothetical protein